MFKNEQRYYPISHLIDRGDIPIISSKKFKTHSMTNIDLEDIAPVKLRSDLD